MKKISKISNTNKKGMKGIKKIMENRAKKTIKLKTELLKNYEYCKGIVEIACGKTGIVPKTFYEWIKLDKQFAQAIIELEPQQIGFVKDKLLQAIIKDDLTAIIFYLKNKHPEFQQERKNEGGPGSITNNLVLFFVNPGDKLPKELTREVIDIDSDRSK